MKEGEAIGCEDDVVSISTIAPSIKDWLKHGALKFIDKPEFTVFTYPSLVGIHYHIA